MVKYEMVFVLDARLSEADKTEVAKHVSELVEKFGGKIEDLSVWIEKQRFSFPMNKVWEGTYYLMNMKMVGPEVARLRRELQIMERLLRFLIIKVEEPKVKAA